MERISYKLTAPGIGAEVASSSGSLSFTVPRFVFSSSYCCRGPKGCNLYCCFIFSSRLRGSPKTGEERTDIIQAIKLGSEEKIVRFCKALQSFSPVDSHVVPEAWDMPGYDSKVIMAGGTFVQGSTMELSADAPLRPPYIIYLQGGLSYDYVKIAVTKAAVKMLEKNK